MSYYNSSRRRRRYYDSRWYDGLGWYFVIGAVMLALFVVFPIARVNAEDVQTCTVEDKDRASNRDGKSSMRVYTQECGVLEVSDVLLKGQFNSADIFADIEVGQTYEFTTIGWRIPILSQFPTIVEAVEVA